MLTGQRIPEQEWQRHKAEIETLYIKEDRTREDVMNIMVERHAFRASKEQYVRRFKKWNLSKNSTDENWAIVGHKVRKRRMVGKESEIYINGKVVPRKRARKEISRHSRSTWDELSKTAASPATPGGIVVCTPEDQRGSNIVLFNIPWFKFQEKLAHEFVLAGNQQTHIKDSDLSLFTQLSHGETLPFSQTLALPTLHGRLLHEVLPTISTINMMLVNFREHRDDPSQQQSSELSNIFTGLELIQALLFLCLNNLSSRYDMDRFLNWIVDSDMRWVLRAILSPKTPTTRILATNLLASACKISHVDLTSLLLSMGADANATKVLEQSALHAAIRAGSIPIVRMLVEGGAEVNPRRGDSIDDSPLEEAVISRQSIELVQFLLDQGAEVRSQVLGAAVAANDFELTRMFLDAGACNARWSIPGLAASYSKRYTSMRGRAHYIKIRHATALQIAAENNNTLLVRVLLDAGSDVDPPPVLLAELEHYETCLSDIIREYSTAFISPLVHAVQHGSTTNVKALLAAGANLDQRPDLRSKEIIWRLAENMALGPKWPSMGLSGPLLRITNTPLQTAAYYENVEMVQLLIEAGASIDTSVLGDTALQNAVKFNNLALTEMLLAHGARVDAPACLLFGRTALQVVSEKGNLTLLNTLLQAIEEESWIANINAPPSKFGGRTSLQSAAENGHIAMVQNLLDLGAKLNGPTAETYGATTVQAAARSCNLDIATLVLTAGADTSTPCGTESALAIAIKQNDLPMFNLLLQNGTHLHLHLDRYNCPILQLATSDDSTIFLESFVRAGSDVNTVWENGKETTALQAAVESNHFEAARLLLEAGADPDLSSSSGEDGPLHIAIRHADINSVKLLLQYKADANATRGAPPCTALARAVSFFEDSMEIIQLLLNAKARVNDRSADFNNLYDYGDLAPFRMSLLASAALLGSPKLVKTLLAREADPNWRYSMDDTTALERAIWEGTDEIIRLIMDAGAEINAPACWKNGRTALQQAADQGNLHWVQILLQKGADVNAPPSKVGGVTALQAASIGGHLAIAILLLDAGADINGERSKRKGRTALEGAAEHGRLDIVYLLLENDHDIEGFYDRCQKAAAYAKREGHSIIAECLRDYRKD